MTALNISKTVTKTSLWFQLFIYVYFANDLTVCPATKHNGCHLGYLSIIRTISFPSSRLISLIKTLCNVYKPLKRLVL